MRLIIDIPEGDYKFIKDLQSLIIGGRGNCKTIQKNVINAIRNGTPYNPSGDLISREALKKYKFTTQMGNGVEIEDIEVVPFAAIDNAPAVNTFTTRDLEDAYIRGKNSKRPQGEWIPVSERLPKRNGVYNVTRKLKEGETIYFILDASYFDGQNTWHRDTGVNHGRPYLTDVIAWQPQPEPYKEGVPDMREEAST